MTVKESINAQRMELLHHAASESSQVQIAFCRIFPSRSEAFYGTKRIYHIQASDCIHVSFELKRTTLGVHVGALLDL